MTVPFPFATDQFILPAYGGGSFADIPTYLQSALVGGPTPTLQPQGGKLPAGPYDRILVLFLDAFGWRFLERFQDHPLLQRFIRSGSVTRLTAQFPSTTSAHVTTLYTGEPVGHHGVFEWFYYEPTVDAMISPLLYSFAGDESRETLAAIGVPAQQLLPPGKIGLNLSARGATTLVFQPREFAFSTYSRTMTVGAQVHAYLTLPEGLANLSKAMAVTATPACIVLYYPSIDAICHVHGPDSRQAEAEIDATLALIERWLTRDVDGHVDNTLLAIFADHGQTKVTPEETIYLNQLPEYAQLRPLLRTNQTGAILAPGGACRDFFVYTRDEHLDEAQALLNRILAGRAEVVKTVDLVSHGYFGPASVSAAFSGRAGSLIVLPYDGEGVFWYEKGRFEQKYAGYHGGLTRAEMEIPLLLLPL